MSYDIKLTDPITHETLHLDQPHQMSGGTFALGGTTKCWINITGNYADFYYRVFGDKGIRSIYGKTGAESIPILEAAAAQLGDDATNRHWDATEGNAKRSLMQLIALAKLRPDGVWAGD